MGEVLFSDLKFQHESDHHIGFYSAIGRACIIWNSIEASLNFDIGYIFHSLGGNEISNKIPGNMDAKIKFWKKSFKVLKALKPKKESALVLARELKKQSKVRNKLLHTHWDGLLGEVRLGEEISGVSVEPKDRNWIFGERLMSFDQLIKFSIELGELQIKQLPLSFFVSNIPRENK